MGECTDPAALQEQSQVISDLFHAINQPLTVLRWSLELSLYQTLSPEQYRECADKDFAEVGRVARVVAGLRELLEADDPGDRQQKVLLDAKVGEIVQDLLPVAEVRKVILDWRCEVLAGAC